jgi:cystathionine beta-lyase/cystathionine gamma-synthase
VPPKEGHGVRNRTGEFAEDQSGVGLDPGMPRFSCGPEDAGTLVADVERALAETA